MPGFCNVENSMEGRSDGVLWQWPRGHVVTISAHNQIAVAGFSRDDIMDVAKEAYQMWADQSGFKFRMVSSPTEANVLIRSKKIDGVFGVLAEAMLPPPGIQRTAQLTLDLDTGEHFVRATNPPSGKIDILRVMVHEGGHTLGIGHEMDPQVPAIMDPSISVLRNLQAWDVNQAQLRYGIALPSPPPGGGGGDDTDPVDPDDPIEDLLRQLRSCWKTLPPATKKLIRQFFN